MNKVNMSISVAIILVDYNGLYDTRECIKSIKNSNLSKLDVKIYVVDNASTIDEASIIKSDFPDVFTLRSNNNLGFSGGNNLAIEKAINDGVEYIILLNNDTIIDPNMIQLLVNNANNYNVTVPTMYYYNNPQKVWYGGGEINKFSGNVNVNKIDSFVKKRCTFATGCCICVPRECFEKIGLLKEEYFMYCEDTEFSIRLLKNRINILLIPEAKLFHKVSVSTGGEGSITSLYYSSRNRLFYINEHRDFFLPSAFFITYVTRYVKALFFLIKGNEKYKAYLQAIRDYKKNKIGKCMNF